MIKVEKINSGMVIEFEGIDACGKTTYINMLKDYLIEHNKKVKVYDFPQYNTNIGKIIAKYLRGEYGNINSIPEEILNILFASDRISIQKELNNYLDEGYIILLNRYTYSNIFQFAKNNKDYKEQLEQLENLEFNDLNIKCPDKVIYLTLPIEKIKKRIENRGNREYQNNKKDIHEDNDELLVRTDKIYKQIAKDKNWIIIEEFQDRELTQNEIFELIIKNLDFKL